MKIVACVKQVPGVSSVKIDPVTKQLIREGVSSVLNPFDYHALEEGVKLRDGLGGELVALSMGPQKAADALKESLAFGADRAVLLCDRRFAGSDTWATSYALALAIKRIGDVDIVLCGKQAVDGDTAQVGPGIAAHLGWAQASGVCCVEILEHGSVIVKRQLDGGGDLCRMRLPATLSVLKDLNEPRVPRLSRWIMASEAEIETWSAEDIGADSSLLGLNGSPTRVIKTNPATLNRGATRLLEGNPNKVAGTLIHELRMLSAI